MVIIIMKRIISSVMCLTLIISCFCSCSSGSSKDSSANSTAAGVMHHAQIVVKDYGTITVELNADKAPITVANFIKLANSGFYDGLTFHRVVTGFVIQGGDPSGDGTGGSDEKIKGEFTANGVNNDLSHTRGAISMARSQAMNSASSQFFICQADCSSNLDGKYAVFGYVTDGMDVVDSICSKVKSSNLVPKADQPVIETIKVID